MIGKEIRAIRKSLGVTQDLMARMLGYSTGKSICDIEADRLQIDRAKLNRLIDIKLLQDIRDSR